MRGREPGTDGYETEDYGTGAEPGHAAVRDTITVVDGAAGSRVTR